MLLLLLGSRTGEELLKNTQATLNSKSCSKGTVRRVFKSTDRM